MTSTDSHKAELVIMRTSLPLIFVRKLSSLVTQQVAQVTTDFLIYIQYMWLVCLKRWNIFFPSTSFVAPKMNECNFILKNLEMLSWSLSGDKLWGPKSGFIIQNIFCLFYRYVAVQVKGKKTQYSNECSMAPLTGEQVGESCFSM